MGMTVKGYVVEPPRIGAANSPFTSTPNVIVLDQAAFDAHFPTDESAPRVEYFVTVVPDGLDGEGRFLVTAKFGWSKNEGTTTRPFARFDYDNSAQAFKLLPGGRAEFIGQIVPEINTDGTRLAVPVPIEGLPAAPYRLSYGEIGGGTTLTLVLVDSFGSPAAGSVECLRSSGDLNWNAADLSALEGQLVRYQRQPFYQFAQSDGAIGLMSEVDTPGLLLNPLPATGQYPMVRIGYGIWLTPVEVANDSSFTTVAAGTVQWSRTSGLLKFNPTDAANSPLATIYYDGVFIQYGVQLPRQALGVVASPANLTSVPPDGGDLIFYRPDDDGVQYEVATIVDDLDDNDAPSGSVLIKRSNGEVRFPITSVLVNGGENVTFVSGDLPLEYGLAMRFYRNVVNPTASKPSPADLSIYWEQTNNKVATLAKPIPAAPFVSIPALPVIDEGLGFDVYVASVEGTGTFVGELKDLSVPLDTSGPSPLPAEGLGYVLSYPDKQLKFARRRNDDTLLLPESVSAFPLPDPLILGTNYQFALEVAPGTGSYAPLTEGLDYLLDPDPGILTLTNTVGEVVGSGTGGSLSGATFQDASSALTTALGDVLVVPSGPAQGVYRLAAGSVAAGVQTDLDPAHHVTASGFAYEVRRDPEAVADRYWKALQFPDTNTRVERIRALGPIQNATGIMGGTGFFTDPSTFSSPINDFIAAEVQPGDTLSILDGPDSGKSFTVLNIDDQHTLTFAGSVTDLSTTGKTFSIRRSLRIDGADPALLRFRFGQTTYTAPGSTVAVPTDSAFSTTLPSGSVQYSLATGNLNFSPADIPPTDPPTVYSVVLQAPGSDYTLQPSLGFIDFTERFLTGEEAVVTYIPLDANGAKMPVTTERISFSILKELTSPTPRGSVTNVLFFNPEGRTVATDPVPIVYRGGRPQAASLTGLATVTTGPTPTTNIPNVVVDVAESKITFLPNVGFMTNALPSGASVGPDERILVDYSVYEALGGEKSVTLLNPVYVAQVILTEDATAFTVEGNHVAKFATGIFRVGDTAVYEAASAVYPNPALPFNTLVTLKPGQKFLENSIDPQLSALSLTPYATAFRPAFFEAEVNPYQTIPRGMNRIKVMGDRTQTYSTGVLLLFTDNATFYDYHSIVSSRFTGVWTEIQLGSNVQRQHNPGTSLLKYTVRPVLTEGVTRARTARTPILSQPYGVFRKPVGQPGQILDEGYSLDDAGVLTYDEPITEGEEVGVWYTGNQYTTPGVNLLYYYTHGIVPEGPEVPKSNGLLGQTLLMGYTVWSADTFFFRVETLTNFRAEVADYFREQAQGSSPSSGPRVSNAPGSPGLAGQGRESLFYQEVHISNMDLVARRFLKYLNDSVNHLEDALRSFDGRVVGAYNGRFRFDGKTNNPPHTSIAGVTNDIDDLIIVRYDVEFSWSFPFFTFVPKFRPMWRASARSRLYPTYKDAIFNVTFAGNDTPDIVTGTPILQFDQTEIDSAADPLFRRYPRALVLETAPAGATVLTVDNSTGTEVFYRPAFKLGMKVDFMDANGTVLLSAQVVAANPVAPVQTITLSAGLPIEIPRGTTVVLNTDDPPDPANPLIYQNNYSTFWDVSFDKTNGTLLYSEPWFGAGNTPKTNEILQLDSVVIRNTLTAPFRFPALDGVAASDSGDMGIPVANRTLDCEMAYLGDEATALMNLLLNTTATDPQSNVSLNATRTVLTRTTSWGPAVPQVLDLVRFTTGANAGAGWRRIIAVNLAAKTVTVDVPFLTQEANQTVLITAAPAIVTGTATFPGSTQISWSGTPLTKGHTIIFTDPASPNYGKRRQITGNTTPTIWTLDAPVTYPAIGSTFRTSNHLSTYSGLAAATGAAENVVKVVLENDNPTGGVDSQYLGVKRFFDGNPAKGTDGILTDLLPPPIARTGAVTANDPTLTGTGVDFLAANVAVGNFVYVIAGANQGFYTISDVANTTLTVDPVFPVTGSVQYRVVSAYALQAEGLNDLHGVLAECWDWAQATQTWVDRLNYQDVVVLPGGPDADTYANNLLTDDLVARSNAATDRQAAIAAPTGPTYRIGLTLGERDGYYDKRYVWIDGRVNVQKGLLYMAGRATKTRIDNLAQQKNDLIKLASME